MRRTVSVYGEVASYQTTQVFVYFKGDFRKTFHFKPTTLPEHVLDDIRSKLRLAQDVKIV